MTDKSIKMICQTVLALVAIYLCVNYSYWWLVLLIAVLV